MLSLRELRGLRRHPRPRPREALGILADKADARLKMECHELFDRTWDTNAERRERYARLAGRLGIPVAECHFGTSTLRCWSGRLRYSRRPTMTRLYISGP